MWTEPDLNRHISSIIRVTAHYPVVLPARMPGLSPGCFKVKKNKYASCLAAVPKTY